MSDRWKAIAELAGAAQKTYKHDVVLFGGNVQKLDRIPIDSTSFNYATGGGIPRGRITTFCGEWSSGKTTVALKVIASAQNLCRHCWRAPTEFKIEEIPEAERSQTLERTHRAIGKCDCVKKGLWVPVPLQGEKDKEFKERLEALNENSFDEFVCWFFDVEGTFDPEWATLHGVDTSRLLLSYPESAERTVDLVSAALQTASIDLIVIDSLAAMTPETEIEVSAEKNQQGLQARLLNKAVRKWVSDTAKVANETHLPPTMIWIQQIRQKIGVMFGDPSVKPGGKGQDFANSLELKFWTSDKVSEKIQIGTAKDETANVPIEITVNFKLLKNKTGSPLRDGSFRMSLITNHERGVRLGQVLESDFIFSTCMQLGIIAKDNNKLYVLGEEFASQKAIKERWRGNRTEYDAIRKVVLNRLMELTV